MPDVLHTPRLILEPWDEDHERVLRRLATTPSVVRHIGDGTVWSDARIATVLTQIDEHWRDHDFGWRLARSRETGDSLGFIMLMFSGEGSGINADEYEIGWWLSPSAWGQGLAREGAVALRDEAFGRLEAPGIVARIHPSNLASIAVARSIGLQPTAAARGRYGEPIGVWRLDAADLPPAPLAAPAPADGRGA